MENKPHVNQAGSRVTKDFYRLRDEMGAYLEAHDPKSWSYGQLEDFQKKLSRLCANDVARIHRRQCSDLSCKHRIKWK